MKMKTCSCGKPIPKRHGSTIQMKKCPSCIYNMIKKAKKKKGGKSAAMRTADKWFSWYIRFKYSFFDASGKELFCKCFTCGRVKPIKVIQLGHYHGRGITATRYHENNGRPQDVFCNYHKHGAHTAFEKALIEEVGVDAVEELKSLTTAQFKATEAFYKEAAKEYREKYNKLCKEKGVDPFRIKQR